ITDFDFNGDDSLLLGPAGSATNFVNTGQTVATYADATALADSILNGTIIYTTVSVGADSFLFWDTNGDGSADEAIRFTNTAQSRLHPHAIIGRRVLPQPLPRGGTLRCRLLPRSPSGRGRRASARRVRGNRSLPALKPPHPTPLPDGEREQQAARQHSCRSRI